MSVALASSNHVITKAELLSAPQLRVKSAGQVITGAVASSIITLAISVLTFPHSSVAVNR